MTTKTTHRYEFYHPECAAAIAHAIDGGHTLFHVQRMRFDRPLVREDALYQLHDRKNGMYCLTNESAESWTYTGDTKGICIALDSLGVCRLIESE
jgi:hypothetical protein